MAGVQFLLWQHFSLRKKKLSERLKKLLVIKIMAKIHTDGHFMKVLEFKLCYVGKIFE